MVAGQPNQQLRLVMDKAGVSRKALAARVNDLARAAGIERAYTHTGVSRWLDGMTPRPPVPSLIADALSEHLHRRITPRDIGMARSDPVTGLEFVRSPVDAAAAAVNAWSAVDRRQFAEASLAITAYHAPVVRWLASPADRLPVRQGRRRVTLADVKGLWSAAETARSADSRLGGAHRQAGTLPTVLRDQATPLMGGTFTPDIGRELYSACAELSRQAGWAALDAGRHAVAQRYFVQALRLAKAAGNVELGGYVLATMALQATLCGWHEDAVDMAQAAYDRARRDSAPRVLAFTKLIEARAHARTGTTRAALCALAESEQLVGRATPLRPEPDWITYVTHTRISSDAVEICRDLHRPTDALRWNTLASKMPRGSFARSVGLRYAVLSTTHIQTGELDAGLSLGRQAVHVLSRVRSRRGHAYVLDITRALQPWSRDRPVREFIADARVLMASPC